MHGYLICLSDTGHLYLYESVNNSNVGGLCTLTFPESHDTCILLVTVDYHGLKSWSLKTPEQAIKGGLADYMAFAPLSLPTSINSTSDKIAVITINNVNLLNRTDVIDQLQCKLIIRDTTYNAIKLRQTGMEILGIIAGVYCNGEWKSFIAWKMPLERPWSIGSLSSYTQYSASIRGIVEIGMCHYIAQLTLEGGYRR